MAQKKAPQKHLKYEELAYRGKNNWWRYVVSTLVITAINVVFAFPIMIALVIYNLDLNSFLNAVRNEDAAKIEQMINDASANIGQLTDPVNTLLIVSTVSVSFFGIWLAVRWLHGRSLTTLITTRDKMDWKRVWTGVWVYGALLLLSVGLGYSLQYYFTGSISINFNTTNWALYAVFVLLLIPLVFLQVFAEELLFRGYIFQAVFVSIKTIQNAFWKKVLPHLVPVTISAVISVLLFGLAHALNAPFQAGFWAAITYFLSAVFFQVITIKDQRLELAVGAHFINNFLAFAIIGNSLDGAGGALAVDTSGAADFNNPLQAVIGALPFIAFYCVVFYLLPKLTKSQNKV